MNAMARASAYRMGLAVCTAYCLSRADRAHCAHVIAAALMDTPEPRRQAAAHRIARRLLAERWDLPVRSLPAEPGRSQAIGWYEDARDQCRNDDEFAAFDLHSMHYAIENGVCPRCAQARSFGDTFGECTCGFEYGYPEPSETGEKRTCTGRAMPRPAAVRLIAKW
jgi:hypothetical protein